MIRTAGPRAFPPFHYVEKQGVVRGIASDYLDIIHEKLGVNLDIRTQLRWPDVLEKAKNKELDLIACAAKSEDRENYLIFTIPYLSFPMVIISRKDSPFIGGLEDLYEKKVAVIERIVTLDWMARDGVKIEPVYTDSPLDKLKAVSVGKADAALENLATASYLIAHEGLANLKIAAPTHYDNYDLHFAVRNDWPELASILNKLLMSVSREEHNAILQKWISVRYEHGVNPSTVKKIMSAIGIAFLMVIFIFLLRNREIRKSEERFRALIEYGADIILAFRKNGGIAYQSPSVTPFLGYAPGELMDSSIFQFIHPRDLQTFRNSLDDMMRTGKPVVIEHRFTNKDGDSIHMESICVDLLNKQSIKAVVLNARDMTQRRQTEKELRDARDQAESANRAKSDFLAKMSHELRTPLNAVIGFSQIMLRSKNLNLSELENLSIIKKSGKHLLHLINDVLDFSKIEAGRMMFNPVSFDLHALIQDLAAMFSLKAHEKGIDLILDQSENAPRYIKTDEIKLKQALLNLMGNAVKFTEQGSVLLTVGVHEEGDRRSGREAVELSFTVSDTGPGIEPGEFDTLFDSFSQTETGKRMPEGAGLGLSICKKFIHLMGGRIDFQSQIGYGSTFSFYLPVEIVQAIDMKREASVPQITGLESGQSQFRILIVDDTADSRLLLIKLLAPLGFKLKEAVNGLEAVEIARQWNPNLIFMDLRMPVMPGYEAVEKIRSFKEGKEMVIIALSASSLEDERRIALWKGCNDFLRKPFKESQIFGLMKTYLGVRFVCARESETKDGPISLAGETVRMNENIAGRINPDHLKAIEKAVSDLDYETIMEIASQIRTDHPAIADELVKHANNYRFDLIYEMISNE